MLRPNARQTKGQITKGDGCLTGTCPLNGSAGTGRAFTITPQTGLGRQWTGDKIANAARFAQQAKADRIAAARDRRSGLWDRERLACNF